MYPRMVPLMAPNLAPQMDLKMVPTDPSPKTGVSKRLFPMGSHAVGQAVNNVGHGIAMGSALNEHHRNDLLHFRQTII